VDFAEVWKKHQEATVLAVDSFMTPVATTKQLHFQKRYAQPCAPPPDLNAAGLYLSVACAVS
jgi:hypothetical protein